MRLFIRIVDGQPFEHPIFEDNFREAFPDVDVDNLPPEFAEFKRVAPPVLGAFEVYEGVAYEVVDGFYSDVHRVRPMTETEIAAKTAEISAATVNEVEQQKEIAAYAVANAAESAKPQWQAWLDALNAWVLVDPLQPNVPLPPRIDLEGNALVFDALP